MEIYSSIPLENAFLIKILSFPKFWLKPDFLMLPYKWDNQLKINIERINS